MPVAAGQYVMFRRGLSNCDGVIVDAEDGTEVVIAPAP
jgi:hypothetical protein